MICGPTWRLMMIVAVSAVSMLALAPRTPPPLSSRAAHLLAIAADTSAPHERRVEAFARLGKLREEATVYRITPFLRWDGAMRSHSYARDAAYALAGIGSPRAIPALRYVWDNGEYTLDGLTDGAVWYALSECGDQEMIDLYRRFFGGDIIG